MGFAADWLTLREPADRAARDAALLHRAVELAGPDPVVMDLGCGTGSTVRTMAPLLPSSTAWRLVDNDESLLELAQSTAGPAASTHLIDITSLSPLPLEGVTLVTASALLDLVTEAWLAEFAATLTVPFYAALTYDGQMTWDPADPEDERITDAFNRHQRGDKGLGAALGPLAGAATQAVLSAAGWSVMTAPSVWNLGADHQELHRELLRGIGTAANEAGAADAAEWTARRVAAAATSSCSIGHVDLLAIPPGFTDGGERGHH